MTPGNGRGRETLLFRIGRFDPERDAAPRLEDIEVPFQPGATLLDYLVNIKWFVDGGLTFRYSCQSAICGSCAMRVNGHAKLVCKTQAHTVWQLDPATGKRVIQIEALGNQRVIRDLVVDIDPFFDRYRAVEPTLRPAEPPPADGSEYRVSPAEFDVQRLVAVCIQCGACLSECNTLAADPGYLGPAALAKAFRFVTDPRDGAGEERLMALTGDGGIWDCTRCCECTQVCPKDVAPMERIVELRGHALRAADAARARGDRAAAAKLGSSRGARHVEHFTASVARSGVLDETRLPVEVMGLAPYKVLADLVGLNWGELACNTASALGQAPLALRMWSKGKLGWPGFLHHPVDGVDEVHRIVNAVRDTEEAG